MNLWKVDTPIIDPKCFQWKIFRFPVSSLEHAFWGWTMMNGMRTLLSYSQNAGLYSQLDEKKPITHILFSKQYKWERAPQRWCTACFLKRCKTSENTAAHRLPRGMQCSVLSSGSSQWHLCGLSGLLGQWQQLPRLTAVCVNDKGKPCQLWRIVDLMTNNALRAIYILDRVNPSSLTNPWHDRTL